MLVRVPSVSIAAQNANDQASPSTKLELNHCAILLVLRERILARANHWVRLVHPGGAVACFILPEAFEVPLVENGRIILCELTGPGLAYDAFVAGERVCDIAWRILLPAPQFMALKDHIGVDPTRLDFVLADGFGLIGKGAAVRPR